MKNNFKNLLETLIEGTDSYHKIKTKDGAVYQFDTTWKTEEEAAKKIVGAGFDLYGMIKKGSKKGSKVFLGAQDKHGNLFYNGDLSNYVDQNNKPY